MTLGVGKNYYEIGKNLFLTKKKMSGEMFKLAPKCIKTFKNIDDYKGEAFNIGINALGTAAVAPIFIAYNPLSKTDENTKKYSAMRQPISAILAVVTQCGLVIPWDRITSNWANEGKLGQYYSQQGFQDSKYLMRKVLKDHPELRTSFSDKSKNAWTSFTNLFRAKDKKVKISNPRLDAAKAMVKDIQADQYAKLYEELLQKGSLTIGGKALPEETLRSIIAETCDDIVQKTAKTLDRYKQGGEKATNKIARAEFLRETKDATLTNLNKIESDLSALGDQKAVDEYMGRIIKEAKTKGSKSEWIKILEEDLKPKGTKEDIIKHIGGIKEKIDKYNSYKTMAEVKEYILGKIKATDAETIAQKEHFEALRDMAKGDTPLAKVIEKLKLEEISVNTKKVELDNAPVKVIDKYIGKIGKRITGTKALSGLVVSLAIMPFTCCALNYLYPRFMDIFFPSLSAAKKGGSKKCQ